MFLLLSSIFTKIADFWEQHALTCSTKGTIGLDCMGCGMQRSLIALFRGDFKESFLVYPATIPLIIMFLFLVLHLIIKFEKGAKILLYLFFINVGFILIPYFIKLYNLFFITQ